MVHDLDGSSYSVKVPILSRLFRTTRLARHDNLADRAGLVVLDAVLGTLYRWVAADDYAYDLEKTLIATVDLILAGVAIPTEQ